MTNAKLNSNEEIKMVIPQDIMNQVEYKLMDVLEISTEGDNIIMRKAERLKPVNRNQLRTINKDNVIFLPKRIGRIIEHDGTEKINKFNMAIWQTINYNEYKDGDSFNFSVKDGNIILKKTNFC